jgi:hypothetical protein
MSFSSIVSSNLFSVPVLVFSLGFLAAIFKSDVKLPDQVYQAISVFLLFSIGLKGGHSLKGVEVNAFFAPVLATFALGAVIPLFAYFALGVGNKLSIVDRGSFAAHYGSTSLVTFTAALLFLENSKIEVEPFATALLTIMEVPGIIVGIYLGSRVSTKGAPWGQTLREVITGKTITMLIGGMVIGLVASDEGYVRVSPFFIDIQYGVLALFLLHLGCLAGGNLSQISHVGVTIFIFAITFPVLAGALGAAVGSAVGLSVGGAAILGVLCASASYIAAPAAVTLALPEAKSSSALISSIGVTFPFNLIIGIPLIVEISQLLH